MSERKIEHEPSQDPRPEAQEPISRETSRQEVHTVAMGGSAIAGAVGGAAMGTALAGPPGTLAGGLVGLVLGAVGGYMAVDAADPDFTYWQDAHPTQPYCIPGYTHENYAPAYRLGYQGHQRYAGRRWEDCQTELEHDWAELKGQSRLNWDQAQAAAYAAWERKERQAAG